MKISYLESDTWKIESEKGEEVFIGSGFSNIYELKKKYLEIAELNFDQEVDRLIKAAIAMRNIQ
ncbi:hypothetical protein BAOM_2963 [Peribacillus asahii]|uniref:Uncharacterized protein n=1 Tax=Peribacillus asahii TaxID=228899 RepID=A0A3Q9RP13_9BACI|nr:hypothetical protein [Peribacillus asahii]AZV43572.1 hypothetical protein BAOM_2963 [Peribacillus asahii]